MILEHAVLEVRPGSEAAFEATFRKAQGLIRRQPGFRSLRLERCLEQTHRYLLLVEWERLTDHTRGFRASPQYEEWRELLHGFYEPFPLVEHYQQVEL